MRDGESKLSVWPSTVSWPERRVRSTTLEPPRRRPGALRTATSLPTSSCAPEDRGAYGRSCEPW